MKVRLWGGEKELSSVDELILLLDTNFSKTEISRLRAGRSCCPCHILPGESPQSKWLQGKVHIKSLQSDCQLYKGMFIYLEICKSMTAHS